MTAQLPTPPADLSGLEIDADAPFSPEQRIWLAGYLAGARSSAASAPAATPADGHPPVHVLYGSETGNAEMVAFDLAEMLTKAGAPAGEPVELDQVDADALAGMERVVIVCSTYGDGEMPDNAEPFKDLLEGSAAPSLESTTFAVCALGDESYEDFCAAGRFIDTRLAELGATRALDRVDCDIQWEEQAEPWQAAVVEYFAGAAAAEPQPASAAAEKKSTWDRKNPFAAVLAQNVRLSGPGSDKEIRHYELALADSGISYTAGDALAVVPCNDPLLVEALLEHLGHDGEHAVGDRPLREVLTHAHEIVTPSKDLVAALAERAADSTLRAALAEDRSGYLWGRDVLELLRTAGTRFEVEEFLELLRPLQHRAYSISSSPLVSPDHIALTVASVRYRCGDREIGGVCSTHLADRLAVGDTTGVFLQPNKHFGPPGDDATDMIMIGPGTGVAPFRGFLQERRARGASGRNWLLFGDRHREHDFLYENELTGWADDGLLTHLDLAFSRDQADKVYVQTRMREHGDRLYAWLQEGAHLYVCGDADRMARDVDEALHEVIATHGGLDADGASAYVADLKREKRYVRDVY
ncbi:sulfite reductase subunit alpha [Pseudonocardia phyllosphaerae]|uniref:sulfite reductase subunit alpha n=1 Tax=Pseudonocardia phyllosphaerae TaxID=3390502 RepID=UPI003979919C